MDKILGSLRWTAALVFIDDVIVFFNNIEEHATHLGQLLRSAREAGLRFSKAKSHFAYSSLTMLGRRISTEGLAVIQDKVAAVQDLRAPTTVKEVWHVMGLFGYYRNFIHKFSIIAAPITALTKGVRTTRKNDGSIKCIAGNTKTTWTDECEQAFKTLKGKLTRPPLLAYPDFEKPFILYGDASHDGMACALHQRCEEAVAKPIITEESEATRSKLKTAQASDLRWKRLLERTRATPVDENNTAYSLTDDGVLLYKGRMCLPEGMMKEALSDCHDSIGHFGFEKTYDRLCTHWFRPGLARTVKDYIASCRICKGAKRSKLRPAGEMTPQRFIENKTFAAMAIDVILGLPESERKNACLVMTDLFTKTVRLRATTNKATAEDIAQLIMEAVVNHGFLPTTIISDRDPKYISALWTAIMKFLKIHISITSP